MFNSFLWTAAQAAHEIRRLVRDVDTETALGEHVADGATTLVQASGREGQLRALMFVVRMSAQHARSAVSADALAATLFQKIDELAERFDALAGQALWCPRSNHPPDIYGDLLQALASAEQYAALTGTATPSKPKRERDPVGWRARAYLYLAAHPTALDAEIATYVGKSASTLSRNDQYQAESAQLRAMLAIAPAVGFRKDDGVIEAVARPSRLVPGTCSECGEAIKISPGDAGALVLCSDCTKSLMQ